MRPTSGLLAGGCICSAPWTVTATRSTSIYRKLEIGKPPRCFWRRRCRIQTIGFRVCSAWTNAESIRQRFASYKGKGVYRIVVDDGPNGTPTIGSNRTTAISNGDCGLCRGHERCQQRECDSRNRSDAHDPEGPTRGIAEEESGDDRDRRSSPIEDCVIRLDWFGSESVSQFRFATLPSEGIICGPQAFESRSRIPSRSCLWAALRSQVRGRDTRLW